MHSCKRNSSEFRLKLKQGGAYSGQPAQPALRHPASQGAIKFSPSISDPAFALSPPLVGSCSLLPALSLSPYDAPTPPSDEANLEAAHALTSVTRRKQQTRRKVQGCCVHPCLTAPLVRSLLASEQQHTFSRQTPRHDNTLISYLCQTRRPRSRCV